MDTFRLVYQTLAAVAATVFFSLLMSAPRKTIIPSSLVGGLSWLVYELLNICGQPEFTSFFIGTLIVAVAAEVLARIYKMPAPVFILPAILPILPGVRIYRTALTIVEQRFTDFRDEATRTLIAFCAITVALAFTSVAARSITAYINARARRTRHRQISKR